MKVTQIKEILKSKITNEVIRSVQRDFKYHRIQPLEVCVGFSDDNWENINAYGGWPSITTSNLSKPLLSEIISFMVEKNAVRVSFCVSIDGSDDHGWYFRCDGDYEPEVWTDDVTFDLVNGELILESDPAPVAPVQQVQSNRNLTYSKLVTYLDMHYSGYQSVKIRQVLTTGWNDCEKVALTEESFRQLVTACRGLNLEIKTEFQTRYPDFYMHETFGG